MSVELTPTSSLRLIARTVILPAEPGGDMLPARGAEIHQSRPLQQRFLTPSAQEVWQDVPTGPADEDSEIRAARLP